MPYQEIVISKFFHIFMFRKNKSKAYVLRSKLSITEKTKFFWYVLIPNDEAVES